MGGAPHVNSKRLACSVSILEFTCGAEPYNLSCNQATMMAES